MSESPAIAIVQSVDVATIAPMAQFFAVCDNKSATHVTQKDDRNEKELQKGDE